MKQYLIFPVSLALLASPALADGTGDRLHDLTHFFEEAQVIARPQIVECTLSGGAQTTCFSITVKAEPTAYTPGPWCPSTVEDGPAAGGIWFHDGEVRDVDGAFVANLAELYGDDFWQLVDKATGTIRVTDSQAACEAAARPNVDPAYYNYCVQCLPEYMPEDAAMTYVIPLEPQSAEAPGQTNQSGSGLAYNGIRLDGPAPVEAILGAYTIAPFDDCGGHVNTHVGYHYHAVTDCLNGPQPTQEHPAQIGLAMDGYGIFTRLSPDGTLPGDLDQCNGHASEGLGYHYHAGAEGSNAILGCLSAQTGCVFEGPDQTCDATARKRRP